LPGLLLVQAPNQDFPDSNHRQCSGFRGGPGGIAVFHQKMRVRLSLHGDYTAPFEADPDRAHRTAEAGELAGYGVKDQLNVKHPNPR
jgi:hypothetical protein